MKHINNFDEFINESFYNGVDRDRDFSKSPFGKFPEFVLKRKSGNDPKGTINTAGKIADFILRNPGLSARQIKAKILGFPDNTKEDFMYHKGGQGLDGYLSAALDTGYVLRSEERPAKWYARLDKNMTIEEIEHKYRGLIHGSKFGL